MLLLRSTRNFIFLLTRLSGLIVDTRSRTAGLVSCIIWLFQLLLSSRKFVTFFSWEILVRCGTLHSVFINFLLGWRTGWPSILILLQFLLLHESHFFAPFWRWWCASALWKISVHYLILQGASWNFFIIALKALIRMCQWDWFYLTDSFIEYKKWKFLLI